MYHVVILKNWLRVLEIIQSSMWFLAQGPLTVGDLM